MNADIGISVCSSGDTPSFFERTYYEQLTRIGEALGRTVVVFDPTHIDWAKRQVQSFVFVPAVNKWIFKKTPIPAVIYDRCFYVNPTHYKRYRPAVSKLRHDSRTEFLGIPLHGKWQLAQMMARAPQLSSYFPHTERYERPQDVLAFLKKHTACVAKPSGGSHGRGIVAIFHHPRAGGFTVIGRSKQNKPLSHQFPTLPQTLRWLHAFIRGQRYILQPYLPLHTKGRLPFDVRVLMQKDEHLMWRMTGMAVRTGKPYALTSNLHGGGTAEKAEPFLQKLHFDQPKRAQIKTKLHHLCIQLPPFIEREHGRLCELGIDIGIDTKGGVWLIEVNSKPGRQVFRKSGDARAYATAVKRPILYAHSLLQGKSGQRKGR